MKFFNLLANKAGKVVFGAAQAGGVSVVVGILATTVMYNTASQQIEEQAVRSLSSVSNTYAYEGLNRGADGLLSSMNIQNRTGSKGVAVGADRERLEGSRSKNDFGLTAASNLENRVSIPGPGAAAATSATDGLGVGGVDMVEVSRASIGAGTTAGSSVPAVVPASGAGKGGQAAGKNSGGQLASASMARASGNAFNAAAGSMGGGSSASGSRSGAGAGAGAKSSSSEGYNFSGAMPSGSSVYNGLDGSHKSSSSFIAAGRDGTVGRGRRSLRDKENDLKDISKRSADAAKNAHRAANEGSRAFLASSQNSGGMSIDGVGETVTTGSSDFATPTDSNLKAIGDWGEQQDDYGDRKEKARKKLAWMWLGTLAGGIALLFAAAAALSSPALKGPWKIAVQAAFMAAILIPCGFLIKEALNYQHEFKGTMMSVISCLTAAVLTGGMMFTVLQPETAWEWLTGHLVKILIGFGVSVGLGLVSSTMLSSL